MIGLAWVMAAACGPPRRYDGIRNGAEAAAESIVTDQTRSFVHPYH